jgi:hypothetical protein
MRSLVRKYGKHLISSLVSLVGNTMGPNRAKNKM